MERLAELKAGFRSLTEAIDTTNPAGRMMMQMVGAFAEFERAMLRERSDFDLRHKIQAATNKSEAFNKFAQWAFFAGGGVIAENLPMSSARLSNTIIWSRIC